MPDEESAPSNPPDNKKLPDILLGVTASPETKASHHEYLQLLIDAQATIIIQTPKKPGIQQVTISRTRDVANDSDTYTTTKTETEHLPVAVLIPFDHQNSLAFLLIDPQYNRSVHFIGSDHLANFRENYSDTFYAGKTIDIDPGDIRHIHTGSLHIPFESRPQRLIDTDPNALEEINRLTNIAFEQAEKKVRIQHEAQRQSRNQLLELTKQRLKKLQSPPPEEPATIESD